MPKTKLVPALGEILFNELGITREQLKECQEIVEERRAKGQTTDIGEVLLKKEYVTPKKLEEAKRRVQLTKNTRASYGNYELEGEPIGKGGMGVVYKAQHLYMNRPAAVKLLKVVTNFDGSLKNDAEVQRFQQEILALCKLEHPNIVAIYDTARLGDTHSYCMEYVDGCTLAEFMSNQKPLEESEAKYIVLQMARALDHAHKRHVIHRDVKPENILIRKDGVAKLTDFGMVAHLDQDKINLTQTGTMVGTPYYASPEQARGQRNLDGRSDIYSLGATFYHCLTGRPVFGGETPLEVLNHHVNTPWVTPKKYNPRLSKATVRIVKKMMKKKAEERYGTMEEVVKALEKKGAGKARFSYILPVVILNVVLAVVAFLIIRAFS